jgi:hypothetical protein
LRRVIADPAVAARTVAATANRGNLAALARAWTAGVPGNGFSTALTGLHLEEWHALAATLLGADVPEVPSLDGGAP